jgi:hypothetical protein
VSARDRLQAILERHQADYDLLSTPGGAWAVVVPQLGARILGAGVGGQNALWVSPFLEACLEGKGWNAGGQWTWLAPELGPRGIFGRSDREWTVPPALDPGSYRRTSAGATGGRYRCLLELHTASGTALTLGIERSLNLEDLQGLEAGVRGARIRFEHTLINRSERSLEAEVGLWSILQVPALPRAPRSCRQPHTASASERSLKGGLEPWVAVQCYAPRRLNATRSACRAPAQRRRCPTSGPPRTAAGSSPSA